MKFWPALLVVVATGAAAAACGGSDESIFVPDGGGDGGDLDVTQPPEPDGGFFNNDTGPGPTSCTPLTCASAGAANCGPVGDGCGGLLQCGTCTAPETCGGGGKPSVCGGSTKCTPKKCSDFPDGGVGSCGPIADGFGGLVTCGTCVAPQTCGGGGVPSTCGGTTGCVPKTAAACITAGINCGPIADGCGGFVDCGICSATQQCGAAGPGKCGTPAAGADSGTCTPKTCASQGIGCGPAGDGCGNLLDCNVGGGCAPPQTCGGGGTPSVCGGSSACIPKTCAQLGATCGPAGDGCGGTLDCNVGGGCAPPQTCGGGGTPSVCGGSNLCVKKTCANYPANSCGPLADGCGSTITCGGACTGGNICGGGGVPSVCGGAPDGGLLDAGCTGFCQNQVTCNPTTTTTTLKGTVRAPTTAAYLAAGVKADPVNNALVYIPNAGGTNDGVQPFGAAVACTQCGDEITGSPLNGVIANTAPDGTFTLTNVPAGVPFPLVIQLGRWRRKITVPAIPSCTTVTLPDTTDANWLRFPRWQAEGNAADNIPQMAIATGNVDTLECVLRKVGIDDREFVLGSKTGRVHMYRNNGAEVREGNKKDLSVPQTTLTGTAAELDKHDMVLFPCEGGHTDEATADKDRLLAYTTAGGRVFATHYSYTWLYDRDTTSTTLDGPFSTTAVWNVNKYSPTANDAAIRTFIDTTFPKGQQFAQWLGIVNALSQVSPPAINVNVPRDDLDPPMPAVSQQWGYTTAADWNNPGGTPARTAVPTIQHFTFNTPVGAAPASQCGRVVFSDFHVANANVNNADFPAECNANPMNAQERVIEFMLFDLASCITPDVPPPPPSCTPRTCPTGNNPKSCGIQGNGCGGSIDCGPCVSPQTCGGGGTANFCGGTGCTPRTCAQAGANCGPIADGCGGQVDCGPCVTPQTCGGGGVASQCGNPSCIMTTCAAQGITCGPAGDGCGGVLQCGDCTLPQTCGGGGSPGVCGLTPCTKVSCAAQNAQCGPVGDGCGGVTQCGPCPPGQTCGGGGPSMCGASTCTPRTCAQAGANCGPIGDGCGGQIDCGPCTQPGQSCGGGGTASVCGGCVRTTCAAAGAECGPIGDGCGGSLDCGPCVAPDTCGGGGTAFKCGHPKIN
jgi:hypothetical protein